MISEQLLKVSVMHIVATVIILFSIRHALANEASGCFREGCQSNDLKMDEPPYFTHPNQLNNETSRLLRQMLNIRCAATGHPEPSIRWTKDSRAIDRVGEVKTRKWTMILKNLSVQDGGFYTCELCNIYGCISHTTKLFVEGGESTSINDRGFSWLHAVVSVCICLYIVHIVTTTWFCDNKALIFSRYIFKQDINEREHDVKESEHDVKESEHDVEESKMDYRMKVFIDKSIDTGIDKATGWLMVPKPHIEGLFSFQLEYYVRPIECKFPLDKSWEFPREQLTISKTLGKGNFGQIFKAKARRLQGKLSEETVAVKTLTEPHTGFRLLSFLREIEMMKIIGKHKNIVNLRGCCTQDGPLYAIFEYARLGDLESFLVKNLNLLPPKELILFAKQVACGMKYLSSLRCIHRDLAARNILVFDNRVAKIADFGLAIDLRGEEYFVALSYEPVPFRWRAPETLPQNVYQLNSDIWSYGVLLWEIMSFGSTPHSDIGNSDVLYDYLIKGNRLGSPDRCPHEIYDLILQCWRWEPHNRPCFKKIYKDLRYFLQEM